MAIDLYWGSGSPYAWRVLLALEYKRIPYRSHLLQFSKQEHKSPQLLRLNPRGRVPVLKDGDYVCYESLAIMTYLDRKYPDPPLFGVTPQDAGTVMRVLCEYQAYAEEQITKIISAIFFQGLEGRFEEILKAVQAVAAEARTIESRLSTSEWLSGKTLSAADLVVFPGIQLLLRALERREAQELRTHFLPMDARYPSIAGWIRRIEALPGYDRTYPPHWRG
ncbi:MAG: glutathione S-transferase family protein [Candidatus Obscuribacterales bacterium]|nr:glutathione S-transferase family protein [Steroidobacteraceae bacterium]